MSYVVALHCVILYCNNGWHVKDGVVHHSHQQWLVAKRLGGGVTVGVRVIGLGSGNATISFSVLE